LYEGSSHNWIHHSTFCKYGLSANGSDYGVVLEIGNENVSDDFTSCNLIEDCHIYHGGHHVLGLNGSHNVVRNNYMHNEPWMPDEDENLWGNRILYLCTSHQGCNMSNLVENNRLAYSYISVDAQTIPTEANKIAHSGNIIRRNLVYQHVSSAFSYQWYRPDGGSRGNHQYHNSIYKTNTHDSRAAVFFTTYKVQEPWIRNNTIKNDIIIDNGRISPNIGDSCRNGEGTTYPDCNVHLNSVIEHTFLSVDGDPLWVNVAIPSSPFDYENQPDFRLQSGSPCINAGGFLTTITSTGGSGTVFTVTDAGYFMDGWGIEHVQGDLIQLEGSMLRARITQVNYDTQTITVDTPLTWTQGQGVSLAYEGSAPDIGAYEYLAGGATLLVTSPNGGEAWHKGEQRIVSWNANNVSGNLVIELLQNDVVAGTITSSVDAATGSFTWTVGQLANGSFVTGQNLKIRISSAAGTVLVEQEIQ